MSKLVIIEKLHQRDMELIRVSILIKMVKKLKITFTRVLLVPDLWINLFSITQATSKPSTKVIWEDNLITVK
jgi:hypothetical protein